MASHIPILLPDEKTVGIVEGLARIQCTLPEAASVLGVHRHTLMAFLKRNPDVRDKWDMARESGKASIRRNQMKLSEHNTAMAIWLGKQYLGQREPRYEQEFEPYIGKKEQAQQDAETAHEKTSWGKLVN